jgi:hypothetical protein
MTRERCGYWPPLPPRNVYKILSDAHPLAVTLKITTAIAHATLPGFARYVVFDSVFMVCGLLRGVKISE